MFTLMTQQCYVISKGQNKFQGRKIFLQNNLLLEAFWTIQSDTQSERFRQRFNFLNNNLDISLIFQSQRLLDFFNNFQKPKAYNKILF